MNAGVLLPEWQSDSKKKKKPPHTHTIHLISPEINMIIGVNEQVNRTVPLQHCAIASLPNSVTLGHPLIVRGFICRSKFCSPFFVTVAHQMSRSKSLPQ